MPYENVADVEGGKPAMLGMRRHSLARCLSSTGRLYYLSPSVYGSMKVPRAA